MKTNTGDLPAKFLGGMLGSALGDAIGNVAFAGMDAANLGTTLGLIDTLSYSDHTAMALGLAEALLAEGRLYEQGLGDRLRRNYQREPWRGYRPGPPTVFALVEEQGLAYGQAAAQLGGGAGAADNGAATRVVPVGLFFADAPDLYRQAVLSATVTHAHPVAIDGAAVLAKAIAQLVPLTPVIPFPWQPWLQELIAFAQTRELRAQLQRLEAMFASQLSPKVAFDYLGGGSTVQSSLPFALYAFLCHSTVFKRALFCAVTHGGERDALGAMTGALAGAYLGSAAIPAQWQAKLENQCYLTHLASALAEKARFPRGKTFCLTTPTLGNWNEMINGSEQ